MKMRNTFKKIAQAWVLGIFTLTNVVPTVSIAEAATTSKIVYPLQEISKLECRFQDFDTLSSNCKQDLPILKTKDYKKYATQNGGYNDYTRLYTVLWGSSYKYGWDVGNGGHIGTDIATAKGTPIYSIADGTVIHSKTDVALGKMVSIEHYINGKKIVSNYAHMSKIIAIKGQKVRAGQEIGKVGSTGNSTGNHLHFQIDLDTVFHPYYYSYKTCPYSYYKISESDICFDELEQNTIDPLLFFETNGSVLNNITVSKKSSNTTNKTPSDPMDIFNKTVYVWYSTSDIKQVQEIYKKLGVYKWSINGKYESIEDEIIAYQISTWVIENKKSLGAGWFGPKTRTQTKKDYKTYLANWGKPVISDTEENEKTYITSTNSTKTVKISKKSLITREEIEAREVKDFLKKYNVSLNFAEVWGNVKVGKTIKMNLSITNKKGKAFKGNMPWGMTFMADDSKVQVFPKKLFYFTDGKRDIFIKGLKEGNITISVKVWGSIIKRIPIKVYQDGKVIYPEKAVILANKTPVIGESNTAVVLLKDGNGKKLINLEYGSRYKINTNNGTKICLKQGSINNLSKIYKATCSDSDYKDNVTFTYNETVSWIVVFDYKSTSKNTKLEIVNTYNNKVLASQKLNIKDPKGLKSNYVYKNDVISLLSQWVANWVNKGYFLEDREITQKDALAWIENALNESKENAANLSTSNTIDNNLNQVKTLISHTKKYDKLSRKQFLDLTYKFLVFDTNVNVKIKNYKDLDGTENLKASYVLNNTTWKDKFGDNYYQPKNNVTRGEAAFIINNVLNQNKNVFLTLR